MEEVEMELMNVEQEDVEMELMNAERAEVEPTQAVRVSAPKRYNVFLIGSVIIAAVMLIEGIDWLIIKPNLNSVTEEKATDHRKTPACEDFYAFACNNLRTEYRNQSQYRFDTMAMMTKRARIFLDDLFTKPLTASDSAILRETKTFHQMCINKTKVETEGIEPVLTVLNEIGGWPLLTNKWKNNESWEEIVGSVNRAGFATFFPFYLQPGNHISLSPILMDLTRLRVFPDEKRTTDYVKYVASLLKATNDEIDDDIKNCIDFESKLQKLTNFIPEDGRAHTLESLRMDYPEIEWKTFFRNVFVSTDIEVLSNEPVFLSHSKYNVKVSELLNKTSAKIIRNYVVWRLIVDAIPLMPEKFREAKNAFEQRTVGQSRNLDCVDALIDKAKISVCYLYIKHYLGERSKNRSLDLIKSIESQAYRFLENLEWMDNNMDTKILQQLGNLKIDLPHPNVRTDFMEVLDFPSNATIFANYRRLAEAQRNLKCSRVRMSPEDDREIIPSLYPGKVDAYLAVFFNDVLMLAAIFQPPLFFVDQPMYLYGGNGFIVAHVMQYSMQLSSVCENETCPSFNRFQERKACMEQLYGGYVLKQLNGTLDGKRTVDENIGDLIGLKLSYRAYEEYAKDWESHLPLGLNFTTRQLFWINTATYFCSLESDASTKDPILTDPHSPPEARVNVAFANTVEFSRDFRCPIGSRMNPIRKCGF